MSKERLLMPIVTLHHLFFGYCVNLSVICFVPRYFSVRTSPSEKLPQLFQNNHLQIHTMTSKRWCAVANWYLICLIASLPLQFDHSASEVPLMHCIDTQTWIYLGWILLIVYAGQTCSVKLNNKYNDKTCSSRCCCKETPSTTRISKVVFLSATYAFLTSACCVKRAYL